MASEPRELVITLGRGKAQVTKALRAAAGTVVRTAHGEVKLEESRKRLYYVRRVPLGVLAGLVVGLGNTGLHRAVACRTWWASSYRRTRAVPPASILGVRSCCTVRLARWDRRAAAKIWIAW